MRWSSRRLGRDVDGTRRCVNIRSWMNASGSEISPLSPPPVSLCQRARREGPGRDDEICMRLNRAAQSRVGASASLACG